MELLGTQKKPSKQSILTSFLPIPLQLEVIIPLQFFSHSCMNSALESCSLSLYFHFQRNCMYSELNSVKTQFSVFSSGVFISLPLFQLVQSSFKDECSQGGDNVTPRSKNRQKLSFLEKYACATNGGIDGLQPEPRSVLHNRQWDQKLPKVLSQKNWLILERRTDLWSVCQTMVHSL